MAEKDKKHADGGESQYEGPTLLRKISPKTVIGKVTKPEKITTLYSVFGVTHGVRTGTGDNGPWVAFLGSFEAIRYSDNQVFQSGQVFVPKAVEDLMMAGLQAAQKADPGASAEFAIEVGVKPSDNTIGYEYTVKSLVKTQMADPLLSLRAKVQAALPAPVK